MVFNIRNNNFKLSQVKLYELNKQDFYLLLVNEVIYKI